MEKTPVLYNRIKAALAEKGMTNIQLSEKLGVKPATVSRWTRNARQPSVEVLFQIARILNTKVSMLLNEDAV